MLHRWGPRWPMAYEAPDAGSDGATDTGGQSNATPGQAGDQQGPGGAAQGQDSGSLQWDTWLGDQPETVQALVDSHTKGLKTALQSERQQRADLAKQLREATKGLEKGSDLEKNMTALTAKLEQAELRARFFEDASKPDVNCTNPRMAMLAAQELGAIDGHGRINWDAIKTVFPEIFRQARPPQGNAGAGTAVPPPGGSTDPSKAMNSLIRRAAGRT